MKRTYHSTRQRIPLIGDDDYTGPSPQPDAFAAARSTVAQLEAERDLVAVCPSWSLAQHCRKEAA